MGQDLVLASLPFVPDAPVAGPVVVVPTAANRLPDRDRIVDDLVAHLRRAVDDVVVVDPASDGAEGLRGAGTVVVGGGDPFHLLAELRRARADAVIADLVASGATYLGISAGAMVAAPSLAPVVGVSPFTPPAGLDLAGLGLTSTLVLVHHDRPGRAAKHVSTLAAHRGSATLVPLRDDELLVERDGTTSIRWPGGRWSRSATVADAAGVADVFGTAARTAWASFVGDAIASFAPTGEDWAPRIEGTAGSGTFPVVELHGRIVAFAATRAPADDDLADVAGVGELHLFYASPAVWGSDTARRLHRRALWDLAAAGHTSAVLWTEDRNDRALRFYARAGWRPEGAHRERTFLGVPITESRHHIDLAPVLAAPDGRIAVDGQVAPNLWQDAAMADERMEVQRLIRADPAAIFAVLADPHGHVSIDASGMLMDATGEPAAAVGDTFVIHMDREALNDYPMGLYDVTVKFVTFAQDEEIAWTIEGQIKPQIGHVYGYRLEPAEEGTLVTSYYDWSGIDQTWKDANIFPVIPESALRATLGILARTVQGGSGTTA